jgi:hypothetical protein
MLSRLTGFAFHGWTCMASSVFLMNPDRVAPVGGAKSR